MTYYNRRTVTVITPPASLAVSVLDMKEFLSLETECDVDMIEAFIEAATASVREYCKRSIGQETLEVRMDGFPGYSDEPLLALGPGMHTVSIPYLTNYGGSRIDLPFGPVQSVTSITTYLRDNTSAVFSADLYRADAGRVYLNESASWPVNLRSTDAIAIRYVSGEAAVPRVIAHAIKVHVAAMYECREGCDMPAACRSMLGPYRRLDQMGFE